VSKTCTWSRTPLPVADPNTPAERHLARAVWQELLAEECSPPRPAGVVGRRGDLRPKGSQPTARPARCRLAQPRQGRSRRRPSPTIGVTVGQDVVPSHLAARRRLSLPHFGHPVAGRRSSSELDQLKSKVFLQGAADSCRPCCQLVSDFQRDVPYCDGGHACVLAATAAIRLLGVMGRR
jgi:hypothetical protein